MTFNDRLIIGIALGLAVAIPAIVGAYLAVRWLIDNYLAAWMNLSPPDVAVLSALILVGAGGIVKIAWLDWLEITSSARQVKTP